jgi:hypothetical protein
MAFIIDGLTLYGEKDVSAYIPDDDFYNLENRDAVFAAFKHDEDKKFLAHKKVVVKKLTELNELKILERYLRGGLIMY